VGQGDCALVTLPGGEHLLVDAGGTRSGRFDVGERVVVPALRALGVTRLDAAVLTHPDFDHAGGMAAVLETLDVGELWENGQGRGEPIEAYRHILFAAQKHRVKVRRTPELCGAHRFGGVRAALTGDIDRETESHLVSDGDLLPADILKLPHHGSASSSSLPFLDALSPAVAVASVGRFNPHGMPHADVRYRLARRGIRLLRTDRRGAVRVSTDGRGIFVSTVNAWRP
jgi:competence protein ComEC